MPVTISYPNFTRLFNWSNWKFSIEDFWSLAHCNWPKHLYLHTFQLQLHPTLTCTAKNIWCSTGQTRKTPIFIPIVQSKKETVSDRALMVWWCFLFRKWASRSTHECWRRGRRCRQAVWNQFRCKIRQTSRWCHRSQRRRGWLASDHRPTCTPTPCPMEGKTRAISSLVDVSIETDQKLQNLDSSDTVANGREKKYSNSSCVERPDDHWWSTGISIWQVRNGERRKSRNLFGRQMLPKRSTMHRRLKSLSVSNRVREHSAAYTKTQRQIVSTSSVT